MLPADASALIVFAHGARDPAWGRSLEQLAQLIAQRHPALAVRVAYLELQTPTLEAAIDELAANRDFLAVLPVFWAANGHVVQTLPRALEAAHARHPHCRFHALPVLSELPGMLPFIAEAATSALR